MTKQPIQSAAIEPQTQEIRFECANLVYDDLNKEFRLTGVPVTDIDFQKHHELLKAFGVEHELAARAVDHMAHYIYEQSIALAIARSMKRTG